MAECVLHSVKIPHKNCVSNKQFKGLSETLKMVPEAGKITRKRSYKMFVAVLLESNLGRIGGVCSLKYPHKYCSISYDSMGPRKGMRSTRRSFATSV